MKQSYYLTSVCEIQRKDNTLRVSTEDGQNRDLPIQRVSELYLLNQATLNTSLLTLLSQNGIPIHFYNYYTFYIGSFYPRETNVSGALLIRQAEVSKNLSSRMTLAKEFVRASAENKYRNLRYYNGRGKAVEGQMEEIKKLMDIIDRQKDIPELMGVEGSIQKHYFSAWNTVVNQEINFVERVKRPPDNMINTLISFVNSVIYNTVLSQIYLTPLDPTISFLHAPTERRFSLCLDIAEVFKPLVGDRVIFSLLNRNQIMERDFTQGLSYLHLTKDGCKKVVAEIDETLARTVMHPILKRKVSYKHLIRLECYKLIKHIVGEKAYEGFTIWW